MHFFEAVGSTLMYRKRGGNIDMEQLNEIIAQIDDFVWGPVMLVLLVGNRNISYISNKISDVEKSRICTEEYSQ